MIQVREAIIVEGKYDKIKLSNFVDALIITTDGFGVFKDKEKQALIRHLADKRGILVLTDSDGAGFVIRNFLKGTVPNDKIRHAFIPDIFGKEKRKNKPSKEGKLGVEGISEDIIADAIKASGAHCNFSDSIVKKKKEICKADLFAYGLSGGQNSAEKRECLKKYLSLPSKMTANTLLDTLNCIMTKDEFTEICSQLFDDIN